VIDEAAVAREDLSRLVATSSRVAAPQAPQPQRHKAAPTQSVLSAADISDGLRREKVQRDMLIGEPQLSSDERGPERGDKQGSVTPQPSGRPKTREEAEETVLQAIRSARVGT